MQSKDNRAGSDAKGTGVDRALELAERVVASMQAQGYRNIEYVLTECHLKVSASPSDKAPRTQYLNLSLPSGLKRPRSAPLERRFVL